MMMTMMMMNLQSSSSAGTTANQSSAVATAGLECFYLEDYLDCVENLPEDLQRNISYMRELDATYQEILRELEAYQLNLQGTDESESGTGRKRLLLQIQRSLIKSQEIFDEKLQVAQQILDMIENKSRQLDVDYRNIGMRTMNFGGGRENENPELALSKADAIQPERSSKRARRQRNDCPNQHGDTSKLQSTAAISGISATGLNAGRGEDGHVKDSASHQTQQYHHHLHHQHHQANESKSMQPADADDKDHRAPSTSAATTFNATGSATMSLSTSTGGVIVQSQNASAASSSSSSSTTASSVGTSAASSSAVAAASSATAVVSAASSAAASSSSSTNVASASAATKKTKKKKRRSKAEMHGDRHQSSFSLNLRGDNGNSNASGGGGNGGSGNGGNGGAMIVDDPLIDPDEPTYCLCQQISYGEMIGCDNDRCSIEWFHFSCVGLTTKPKGKWYCPRCRGDRPNVPRPGVRS